MGDDSNDNPIDEFVEYWEWARKVYDEDIVNAILKHGEVGINLLEQYKGDFVLAIDIVGNVDDIAFMVMILAKL